MPYPVAEQWLIERVPTQVIDGELCFRWTNRQGLPQFAPVAYLVETFGATIEQALTSEQDVVEAVLAGDFEGAWKDIWALWREYDWV